MSDNKIILSADNANVAAVVADGKAGRIVYKRYVEEFKVANKADISAHVAALTAIAFPDKSAKTYKADAKRFSMRVRAGLNYYVETTPVTRTKSGKYVTAEGLACEDREAFLIKCAAEYDAANARPESPATDRT